jgi:SNF2 family DNA or RNA helicase
MSRWCGRPGQHLRQSDTFQRQGLVLQMILALKQVCNHPAQYLKQGGPTPRACPARSSVFDLLDDIRG